MKKWLLMLSLIPCLVLAQEAPEKRTKSSLQLKWFRQSSFLRSDQPVMLDSIYVYNTLKGRLLSISRFTNENQERPVLEIKESISNREGIPNQYTRMEYLYSEENGNMIAEVFYSMTAEGEWYPTWKYEYEYNEFDKLTEQREYRYKEEKWVLNSKMTGKTFNERGDVVTVMDSIYETDDLQVFKEEFLYEDNYTSVNSKIFVWDEEWIPVQINELAFDDNGNLIHDKAVERYDGGEWLPYYEIIYTYDERNGLIREEEFGTSDLLSSFRYQNYYSDNLVTKNEPVDVSVPIRVIMDPESGTINIELEKEGTGIVSIINMSGKKVFSQRLNAPQTLLSVSSLPKGVYLVHVNTPDSRITQKIIIR